MNTIIFKVTMWLCNNLLKGTRFFELKRKLFNFIGIKIGDNTKIVGPINVSRVAKLEIGDNNWIGTNLTIHGNGKVVIGDNNDFGPDITILTGTHEIGTHKRRAGKGVTLDYVFGNGNWIGAKSTFINGSGTSHGVIIGACSLVTKNTESNSLYIGTPARKMRELEL